MDTMALFRQRLIQAAVAAAALCASAAHAAQPLNVPPDPLATPSTSIQPNVMLLLDDSGSMGLDILPDYITNDNDTANINASHPRPTTSAACADSGAGRMPSSCVNCTALANTSVCEYATASVHLWWYSALISFEHA